MGDYGNGQFIITFKFLLLPLVRRFDSTPIVQLVLNSRASKQFKQNLVLRSHNLLVVLEQSDRPVLLNILVD